jgi:hypothetical protein
MRGEIPMKGGDEQDAFTGWRRYLNWAPGRRKSIKRGYHKRVRRLVRRELRGD